MRMRFLFGAALALLLPAAALAQSSAGSSGGGGGGGGSSGPYFTGQYTSTLPSFANGQVGYLSLDSNGRMLLAPTNSILSDLRIGGAAVTTANPIPVNVVSGGGGAGSTGSVTAAGTNGTQAQAVQGITGGVPQNAFSGQYNSTLPTFANAQVGYVALDSNGRQIISPSSSIAVTNAGTFTTQNTAAVIGGNTVAVKTDGSATTQPISAASLPLPTGAATAANQNSTAAGTSATSAMGVQGVTGGVPFPISASALPLPAGAATAANQATEITALQAMQQRALLFQDYGNTSAAASATLASTIRDLGATPAYSKVNFLGFSNQAGTFRMVQCQDSACATPLTASVQAVAANGYVQMTAPVVTRWVLIQYINGATAASVYGNTSFTAN